MAILAECPYCHQKQSTKNRVCKCGADLIKAKRAKNKVRYWIVYRVDGRQRKEFASYSIEEAKVCEGKRKVQKVEEPHILETIADEKKTFKELSEWYLNLKSVRKLISYERVKQFYVHLNKAFGDSIISSIKPLALEEYQEKREEEGAAPATIDKELTYATVMIDKAFYNDKVSGHIFKIFKTWKKKLKTGDNARKITISVDEYFRLTEAALAHLKPILIVGYNTGLRLGEIQKLKWSYVDKDKKFIRLPKEITKEKKPKNIPMNYNVIKVLNDLPRALHHDFVFTYKGEPLKKGGLQKPFIYACRKINIPHGRKTADGVTFHDIRGSVKTNMLRAGIDKVYRDVILGHSLKGMDVHYMAPSENDLHRAMDKYTEWLDGQLEKLLPKTLPKSD